MRISRALHRWPQRDRDGLGVVLVGDVVFPDRPPVDARDEPMAAALVGGVLIVDEERQPRGAMRLVLAQRRTRERALAGLEELVLRRVGAEGRAARLIVEREVRDVDFAARARVGEDRAVAEHRAERVERLVDRQAEVEHRHPPQRPAARPQARAHPPDVVDVESPLGHVRGEVIHHDAGDSRVVRRQRADRLTPRLVARAERPVLPVLATLPRERVRREVDVGVNADLRRGIGEPRQPRPRVGACRQVVEVRVAADLRERGQRRVDVDLAVGIARCTAGAGDHRLSRGDRDVGDDRLGRPLAR